jgi:hypothetical protein
MRERIGALEAPASRDTCLFWRAKLGAIRFFPARKVVLSSREGAAAGFHIMAPGMVPGIAYRQSVRMEDLPLSRPTGSPGRMGLKSFALIH